MMRCTSVVAALLAVIWIGCSPTNSGNSPRVDSVPTLLLEYYDQHFDATHQMLLFEFDSPGYHSQVAADTPVHPTRESLIYALALLQRNAEADAARAANILRKVLDLQDIDSASETYGIWPWLLEEPLGQMAAPDFNWADFCGAQIAHILVEHSGLLSPDLRQRMRSSLRHAAQAIRKRDVGPGYTNIAILGGGVCAVAGELLNDPELLAYGRRRLEKVVEHTDHHGSFNEYNSPPYTKVVIAECERTLQLVEDRATRTAAESLRRSAWQAVAGSFHPGTHQWAGPHSRTSRNRLRKSTTDFLSRRIDVPIRPHPCMIEGRPRGHAVVRPLPCPAELQSRFHALPTQPLELRRIFVRSKLADESIAGCTWLATDVCLGTVNQSSFWTQRKPLVGYWKTDQDPAVVLRLRFLHDGRDFASMGARTIQVGPRALSVFHSVANRGDWHRTLDRPKNGVFHAADFRVRYELVGAGVDAEVLGQGRFALTAGDYRAVIHTGPGHFDGQEVVWQLGRDQETVFLEGICHHGERKAFDFGKPVDVDLVAGLEILGIDEPIATTPPKLVKPSSGRVEPVWEVFP